MLFGEHARRRQPRHRRAQLVLPGRDHVALTALHPLVARPGHFIGGRLFGSTHFVDGYPSTEARPLLSSLPTVIPARTGSPRSGDGIPLQDFRQTKLPDGIPSPRRVLSVPGRIAVPETCPFGSRTDCRPRNVSFRFQDGFPSGARFPSVFTRSSRPLRSAGASISRRRRPSGPSGSPTTARGRARTMWRSARRSCSSRRRWARTRGCS
jgi:hypothetical protein